LKRAVDHTPRQWDRQQHPWRVACNEQNAKRAERRRVRRRAERFELTPVAPALPLEQWNAHECERDDGERRALPP